MPQDQLTPAQIAKLGNSIATAVRAALTPVFDKLAEALTAPPGPIAPAKPAPPAPAAPPAPRTLAELREENHFLRSIAGQVEEKIRLATPGSTSLAITPSLERIAAAQPATLAALEEENGFLNKLVEHLLKQLEELQGEPS